MRIQSISTVINSTLARNPEQAILILGAPGVGKTDISHAVAEHFELPKERVLLFRPSLRDPVDLMGVPAVNNGATKFNPPAELLAFAEGTGKGLIIWDELPQAVTQMQNAIAGCLLDRVLGDLKLDREVMQIATGNRTTDKAGANRIVSQLGNRVMHLELEAHLDDWCKWAFASDIDPLMIAFVRLKPNLLNDFDPNRLSNPTPRSWALASKSCDPKLPRDLFFESVSGLVGEGAAIEYVAFRDLAAKMPNIDAILMNPETAEIPEEVGVKYAVCSAIATRTSTANFDRAMKYLERMPVEFSTMAIKDCMVKNPEVTNTKAFTKWACDNAHVFV